MTDDQHGLTFDIAPMDFGLGEIDLDLSAFDLGDVTTSAQIETRYCKPRLYRHTPPHAVKYDNAAKLAKDIGPAIIAGERIDALVSGNFIFGDFLEALAVAERLKIQRMTITTLSFGQENIDSLHNLIKWGALDRLDIIVSDYFYSHNRDALAYAREKLDINDSFQIAVAGVHTKTILMEARGRKIVMTGSANLRSSRSIEVFTVETNPELYDFHLEWQEKILAEYATIRKSIRAGDIYNLIEG